MWHLNRLKLFPCQTVQQFRRTYADPGSGAGKGGGGGGSIREAGGAFGKMQVAKEEEYFYKERREQLEKLKAELADKIKFHEEEIKKHREAIYRHTEEANEDEDVKDKSRK